VAEDDTLVPGLGGARLPDLELGSTIRMCIGFDLGGDGLRVGLVVSSREGRGSLALGVGRNHGSLLSGSVMHGLVLILCLVLGTSRRRLIPGGTITDDNLVTKIEGRVGAARVAEFAVGVGLIVSGATILITLISAVTLFFPGGETGLVRCV
jgi:hypothetical protein